jgi:hypothetical protein
LKLDSTWVAFAFSAVNRSCVGGCGSGGGVGMAEDGASIHPS